MVTKDELKRFYQQEGKRENSNQERVYSKATSQKRYIAVTEALKKAIPKRKDATRTFRMIEIGCAEGLYLWEAIKINSNILSIGVDISLPKVERAFRHPNIVYMGWDWDEMYFAEKSFDLVLATEVIEHALDPQKLIDKILRIGERAIITVPIKENEHADPLADLTGHLHTFRPETIKQLLAGHKIINEYIDNETGFILLDVQS
jgi:SAM-dependent methyltransferase